MVSSAAKAGAANSVATAANMQSRFISSSLFAPQKANAASQGDPGLRQIFWQSRPRQD
jgi:hypothetical protein